MVKSTGHGASTARYGVFGFGSLSVLLLVACGGTLVDPPGGSSGSAGASGASAGAGAGAGGSASSGAGAGGSGALPAAGSGGSSGSCCGAGAAGSVSYFSPDACKRAGGLPVPSTGGKQTPEVDCESGVALGVIDAASSGWDEGGLCCAVAQDPVERACGARAGNPCSATEYCAYVSGQYCGAADAESFCKPRPEQCIELYAPVCGCDGKTYDNSCFANAAGTGVNKAGACQ